MDVAAADAFAKKRLRQVPRLHKKVQEARVIHDYKEKGTRVDAELAAAQARLAQLQQAAAAPAGRLTTQHTDEPQPPSTALQQTIRSSKSLAAGSKQESKQQLKQVCQVAAVLDGAPAAMLGTSSKVLVQTPPVNPATAARSSSAAAVTPPLIPPARAAAGHLGTAASLTNCPSSAQQQPKGKHSRRSTSSSNGGSSAACSHRIRRSASSFCSREQQQKQQQLATADGILAQINDYLAVEASQADAAVQSLLLAQQQQQQQQAAAEASGAPLAPELKDNSNIAATSNTNRPLGPGAGANSSTGDAAAKAAALQALGIDSDSDTPELLASLAMRFQAYNLPPGLNSMPDLGTIALAVQQQEQGAAQQRQQEQQEWLLQQQRLQLARQSAANRHLQLYQLGVVQQRARLQQGSSLVGHACITGASNRSHLKPIKQQQQQQQLCDARCQHSTTADQQQQPPLPELGHGGPDKHARFSSAGFDAAAAGGAPSADAAQAAVLGEVPVGAKGTKVTYVLPTAAAVAAATPATEPNCSSTLPEGSKPRQAGSVVLPPSHQQQHQQRQQHCAGNSTQPQQAASVADGCQAAATATASSSAIFISSTAPTVLLQQPLPSQAAAGPPQRRYKSDVPGAAAGASHGHLSPTGLTFSHLPGSRRQVYARIQDALACSDAIIEAEHSLRALTYAPCSRTAAANAL